MPDRHCVEASRDDPSFESFETPHWHGRRLGGQVIGELDE